MSLIPNHTLAGMTFETQLRHKEMFLVTVRTLGLTKNSRQKGGQDPGAGKASNLNLSTPTGHGDE